MKRFVRGFVALVALALTGLAQAQTCVRIGNVDSAYGQSFDTLAASGSSAALPAGWAIHESGNNANGAYAAGTGTGNAGDTYSFGAAGSAERALGAVRSGSLVSSWGACFVNGTGAAITALDIAYTGEQWRLGAAGRPAPDRIDFQYSLDATGLAGGNWIDVDALDFAAPSLSGTAGARDGNAAAFRTSMSATLGALNLPAGAVLWMRWTDFDVSSSDDGLAIDDVAVTARGAGGGGLPRLEVSDASADEGDSGATPLFFTFRLDQPAGANGVRVDYATVDDSAVAGSDYAATASSVTIPAGETTVVVSIDVHGDIDIEDDESFVLEIIGATGVEIADAQGTGTIRSDDFVITPVHAIQGADATSPIVNQFVTTTGIVTGRKGNGFFLQASDAEADADPLTSEGVFVFTGSAPPAAAAVGNRVRVRGTVVEFVPPADPAQLPLTEIAGSPTVALLSTGHALPAPVAITAAMTDPAGGFGQLEPLEGMRVTAASLTTIAATNGNATPYNATGSVNGILSAVLTGVARPFREPGIAVSDSIPGGGTAPPIPRWDGNPEILTVDSDTLGGPAYLLDLPAGSVIEGLTGPLDYGFRRYTLHRDPQVPVNVIASAGPRASRAPGEADFTVAAYNLERFYDAVNDPGVDDSVATATAYGKRLQKASLGIIEYLHAPDVLVAIEVEKLQVLQALAAKINLDAVSAGRPDPQYVAYLEEGNDVGGIDVGFLVKTAGIGTGLPRVEVRAVAQLGKDAMWVQPDGVSALLNDRPPLVLDAVVHYADGRAFPITVVGVHQRSLIGAEDDTAAGERIRLKRQRQAEFLAGYIQQRQSTDPATRIVVLGDFNAFAFNDGLADTMNVVAGTPVPDAQTVVPGDGVDLVDPDLVNLGELAPPEERYSYVFDGNAQTLDHVLVNEELIVATRNLSVDHARINADFSDTHRSDATTTTRTADHDPVIVYFQPRPVADLAVGVTADQGPVPVEGSVAFAATVRNHGPESAEHAGVGFALDAELPSMAVVAPSGWSCDAPQVGDGRTSIACHAASLAHDGVATFAITATTTPGTAHRTLTLAAAVDAASLDRHPQNDGASASLHVAARVDLSARIVGPQKKLHYGRTASFTVALNNAGPYTAAEARMTLRGDAPASHVSIHAPAGWQCAVSPEGADAFRALCRLDTLLAIDANAFFDLAIRVPARADSTQLLTLAATAGSASFETAPANDEAIYRNRIVGVP